MASSLRKQPTFCNTTTGFPAKWSLRNECRNSILIKYHYPDLASRTCEENLLQPIRQCSGQRTGRKRFHTFYHNTRAHKVSGALEVELNCVLYSGLNFVLVQRKNKWIKTTGIPGGCCTTVGPTGSVGRSIEYILCKLAEGLSSDPVGESTGLPCRPPARGDIWPAVITQERFPVRQ